MKRSVILAALVFSGFTALVYQIIWTRLLGFAFGTTTEAISTVLAVFFGGMALGNLAAARWLPRVERPLAAYARLEAAIGLYALLSLPLLQRMDGLYAWIGAPDSALALVGLRVAAAACVLLPPTVAMGATLPVVARAWVDSDDRVGRGSAQIYAANTLGAVAGAYFCGFWLLPYLGLTHSVWLAGLLNLAVALAIFAGFGSRRVERPDHALAASRPAPPARRRAVFLACFGVSGFVAIGYEIVWSKVFGVVMEGTLYGFAAVLSAFLLGIGAGSLAISQRVDRIRDLPRAFALLHVAIGVAVVLGTVAVPYLPFFHDLLGRMAPGGDAVHVLYALVVPIVLIPTALFGAAFPILIRLDAADAPSTGRSVGIATAINTGGSIAASLLVGFWWIPAMGVDGTLYLLLLFDFGAAILLLVAYQASSGRSRLATLGGAAAVVGTALLSFGGVQLEQAIAGRQVVGGDLASYRRHLERLASQRALTIEGRSSVVSVYATPQARLLRTNGQPEAGLNYAQPYLGAETVLLGTVPYALAERPESALVIGLGGGSTVSTLVRTQLRSIDVVELERGVVRAVELLREGRPDPFADPRVTLRIADGRNDLLMRRAAGLPGYDVIASQPSHPWRVGAANLFTEDFFRIVRDSLDEGGVFASWLNGFRIDEASLLAVIASFERVFPGAIVIDASGAGREAFLLAGGKQPIRIDPARVAARLGEAGLAPLLAAYRVESVESLLARVEGPAGEFAALDPDAENTDDNAFVETRTPRRLDWPELSFGALDERLGPDAPLLPPLTAPVDWLAIAEAIFERGYRSEWPYRTSLERLLRNHAREIPAADAARLRAEADLHDPRKEQASLSALWELAAAQPDRPEPLRVIAEHLASRRSKWREASQAFGEAWKRSREARDAYDAGRALHPADPEGAWRWFDRIGAEEREAFPRLAYYATLRALARRDDRALEALYPQLVEWLATPRGRQYPGGHEVASRAAFRLGRDEEARAHADADQIQRKLRAGPHLGRARRALAAGRLDQAGEALEAATRELPGDSSVILLRAELAAARGDAEARDAAFASLRRFAPTVEHANVAENHFRTQHGLPLREEEGTVQP